jgi:hypothetical protein
MSLDTARPIGDVLAYHFGSRDPFLTRADAAERLHAVPSLPVPFAALTSYRDCAAHLEFRYADLVESAVRRLAERGARRVAVIFNITPEPATEIFSRQDVSHFYEIFAETAASLGLETRPEWFIHPASLRNPVSITSSDPFDSRFGELWYEREHRCLRLVRQLFGS